MDQQKSKCPEDTILADTEEASTVTSPIFAVMSQSDTLTIAITDNQLLHSVLARLYQLPSFT